MASRDDEYEWREDEDDEEEPKPPAQPVKMEHLDDLYLSSSDLSSSDDDGNGEADGATARFPGLDEVTKDTEKQDEEDDEPPAKRSKAEDGDDLSVSSSSPLLSPASSLSPGVVSQENTTSPSTPKTQEEQVNVVNPLSMGSGYTQLRTAPSDTGAVYACFPDSSYQDPFQ